VVVAGEATTDAVFVTFNPVAGVQLYTAPPVAVKVVFSPRHMLVSPLTVTVGNGLMVSTTESFAVHPFASVTVTWYWVVIAGEAITEAVFVTLNPVAGVQLYVTPPVAAKVVFSPGQIAVSALSVTVG
jgi:type IV secretory pathway VirB9-like protein